MNKDIICKILDAYLDMFRIGWKDAGTDPKIAPGLQRCNDITNVNQLKAVCKLTYEYINKWADHNNLSMNHEYMGCICSMRDVSTISYDRDGRECDYEAWCEVNFCRHQNVCRATVSYSQYEIPEVFTCCVREFTFVDGVHKYEKDSIITYSDDPCRDHPSICDLMTFIDSQGGVSGPTYDLRFIDPH